MSKKLEALKAVREYVEERKNIQFNYIQVKEDGYVSYDAIGHIAHTLEISDQVLQTLEGDSIESDDEYTKEFADILIGFGFTIEELEKVQELNDSGSADQLVEYIDELIEALVEES